MKHDKEPIKNATFLSVGISFQRKTSLYNMQTKQNTKKAEQHREIVYSIESVLHHHLMATHIF